MKAETYKQKLIKEFSGQGSREEAAPDKKPSRSALMKTVASTEGPIAERLKALNQLRGLSFGAPDYYEWREDLFKILRGIVANEGKSELSFSALELLAQDKDAWALSILEQTLRSPRGRPVSAYDALRLLAYDDHGSHFDILRELSQDKKKGTKMRLAAIRQLGADPGASDMLANVAGDQGEVSTIRRQALAALRQANRDKYDALAKKIVADDGEEDDVRAQCITAMQVDGGDQAMTDHIRRAVKQTKSETVRSASESYLEQLK